MSSNWRTETTYIAHIDLLGFKSLIDNNDKSFAIHLLKSSIDSIIKRLESEVLKLTATIGHIIYADTFLIHSRTKDSSGYPHLVRIAKNVFNTCILNRLPARCAISYGEVSFGHNERVIIGKAALESFQYCGDQDWIGLLLTPSATHELKRHGVEPIRHGFINSDIPLRSEQLKGPDVYAYKFINGNTNFSCPLLPILDELQSKAPESAKIKYQRTIEFISKHYPKTIAE